MKKKVEKIFLSLVGSVFVIVERMNRKEKVRSNRKSIKIFNNIFFYKMLIL